MNLSLFMNRGIQSIGETAARFYLKDRTGRAFMKACMKAFQESAKRRQSYEEAGTHIPPFLIASIASGCNLRCAGCYAHANGACSGDSPEELKPEDWKAVFREAAALGISFILLAGGEPLLRREVLEEAARQPDILFPVFTNGTLMDEEYLALFDQNRNLIPVLSLEGDEARTDARRGPGVAHKVQRVMDALSARGMLFGVSVTVTSDNMEDVTAPGYVEDLRRKGCGLVFYVEYVPAEPGTEALILSQEQLHALEARLTLLRGARSNRGMILLSFPGDEENMGGCLAAGRGFFHINPQGGAEPCPFSPVSSGNVRDGGLLEALRSPFFAQVRKISAAQSIHHKGGCALFQVHDQVLEALPR